MSVVYKLFFISLLLNIGIFATETEAKKLPPVKQIVIDGNTHTKESLILKICGFKVGMTIDSSIIKRAEKDLLNSGIFSNAKIFILNTGAFTRLFVTLKEKSRISLSDIGGGVFSTKWGKPYERPFWFQFYFGADINNFRGMGEKLNITTSVWAIRYLSFSWNKPIFTTPWSIRVGTIIGSYPSITTPWNVDFFNSSFIGTSRKITNHTTMSLNIVGKYKKYSWKGNDGYLYKNGIEINPFSTDLLPLQKKDTTWNTNLITIDTVNDTIVIKDSVFYEWKGVSSKKLAKYETPFSELFLFLNWQTDKRDRSYNPQKGFLYKASLFTNAPYPYRDINGVKQAYLQLDNDFRLFHKGFFKNNTVAYRARLSTKFFGENNIYSGMYIGGESYLRGYSTGFFGGYEYNNKFLFSTEYRFVMFPFPTMRFPWLRWYDENMQNLTTRFYGAVIFDYGYIWKKLANPRTPSTDHIAASGIGFGIRVLSEAIKRSVCFDIVWPVYPSEYALFKNINWYLYLDLPF